MFSTRKLRKTNFMSVFDAKRIFQQEVVKFSKTLLWTQNWPKHTFRDRVVSISGFDAKCIFLASNGENNVGKHSF